MNDFAAEVKGRFNSILESMSNHHWLFSTHPGHDFMRQHTGKLSFEDTMRMIICMGKGSTADEINEFFDFDPDAIPSLAAFNQRRAQISLSAFQCLFTEFSSSFPSVTHQFKGRSVLAFDGTHIVYATNAEILEDYNKPRLADYKGFNHMHLNGFVDVISKVFIDAIIQPGQQPDEREAMRSMLEHFSPDQPEKYIITADRGYESYDMIFLCTLKHLSYVFRVKSPKSSRSILSRYIDRLPDEKEEFDITIKEFFTDHYNKVMKEQKNVYHYMNPSKTIPHFQELLGGHHLRYLTFRVVKIKCAEGAYEYLLTNLPSSFTIDDIRECYHLRWGIELSFRFLKHANSLLHFHSKKPEFLKQEIYAGLIRYNIGMLLANHAADVNRKTRGTRANKYQYEVDISQALKISRKYIQSRSCKAMDVIRLMIRYVHAVKEKFRKFDRPLHGIGAVRFAYR